MAMTEEEKIKSLEGLALGREAQAEAMESLDSRFAAQLRDQASAARREAYELRQRLDKKV